jgi:formate/nitrite transporter FocA (FNT family)
MTWMERATESVPAKLAAAMSAAFLLVAGTLNHAIVVSLLAFAALHAGAPFGYLHWLGMASFAALGNIVGGVGLVTVLRLVQVGQRRIEQVREEGEPRDPLRA